MSPEKKEPNLLIVLHFCSVDFTLLLIKLRHMHNKLWCFNSCSVQPFSKLFNSGLLIFPSLMLLHFFLSPSHLSPLYSYLFTSSLLSVPGSIVTHITVTPRPCSSSSSALCSHLQASSPSPACDLSPLFHSSSLTRHHHICVQINQRLFSVFNTSSSSRPPKILLSFCPLLLKVWFLICLFHFPYCW